MFELTRQFFHVMFGGIGRTAKSAPIVAAAQEWRTRLANASTTKKFGIDNTPVVTEKLTDAELDAFEKALTQELARAKVYVPDFELFNETGIGISLYLSGAAREAGIKDKISTFGWLDRMRIRDDSVDVEIDAWRSNNWQTAWAA